MIKTYADDYTHGPQTMREIRPGQWAVAKPLTYFGLYRFQQAWDVLTGRAHAIHFREDTVIPRKKEGEQR